MEVATLSFVPLVCAEQPEGGTGFGIFGVHQSAGAKAITLTTSGTKLFKAVDSEAAVNNPLTWERIIKLEPQVVVLLTQIQAEWPTECTWPRLLYGYKEQLSELVGWDREETSHPESHPSAAYNLVYHKLLDCLVDRIPPLLPSEICQSSTDKGWNQCIAQELIGVLWNVGVLK